MLAGNGAAGTQLLANPGFEDGVDGWTADEVDLETSVDARSGGLAGKVSRAEGVSGLLAQEFPVQGGSRHAFSGWVNADDPNLFYVWLRITWYDASNTQISSVDSPFLVGAYAGYRYVSVEAVSPPPAVRVRAAVYVTPAGGYSFLVDDLAFEESPGPTPATDPPTSAPTQPSSTPLSTPSTPSTTAQPTPAPTNTPTASPTPSPRSPLPTPDEPTVFASLANGDFEQLRDDGTLYGWRKIGGAISASGQPIVNGQRSLALTSEGTNSTKWAYQGVSVVAGGYYEASALAWLTDFAAQSAFLRVSWYESDNTTGESIDNADSTVSSPSGLGVWQTLATGPIQAPDEARSARVRLMLRPAGDAEATVYFEAVRFVRVAAPTDAPQTQPPEPTASPVATTPPTQSPVVPASATPEPPPSPTISPSPTIAPTAVATSTPVPEPDVFAALTNGSFELARDDGSPYAWSKAGGEIAASDFAALDGSLGLELVSRTTSTKWAYQAVAVEPGAYYAASAWAMAQSGVDIAVIRVSWYTTESADGQALSSDDSGAAAADGSFHFLSTGAIQAPTDARTAKVRLLVRPTSGSVARAAFDAVTFGRVDAPLPESDPDSPGSTSSPRRNTVAAAVAPASAVPVVAGAFAVPDLAGEDVAPQLANVRPAPFVVDGAETTASSTKGSALNEVLQLALISVGLAGLGAIFAQDLWRQSGRPED
jgi:hypothetical protein